MKKEKKKTAGIIIRIAVIVLLVLLLLPLAANAAVTGIYGKRIDTAPDNEKFDCILILGARVFDDGSVSAMLEDRLDRGIELYFAGVSNKILVSGDHGTEGYDEVNAMKDAAMAQDVPSEDIFMDHAGFATYDSFYRAGAIFGVKKVVIVTQAYHLPRALWIARALGLEAVGVSCDTRRYAGQLYRDVREILARDKDFFKCILKPLPRYLGEAIPIWGSGDATNDRG